MTSARTPQEEWLWGWDPTPGIVSVHAELDGRAIVWRRLPDTGTLVREDERFRPWALVHDIGDLQHLGAILGDESSGALVRYRELDGPGALRYLVTAHDGRELGA